MDKYIYVPLNTRWLCEFARGCRSRAASVAMEVWRKYRVRDPKKFADEIETSSPTSRSGLILADEEPTIHRKKFVAFCED